MKCDVWCVVWCLLYGDATLLYTQAMESKLLAGGLNIFDRTNEQERELEQQRQKMIEQKVLSHTQPHITQPHITQPHPAHLATPGHTGCWGPLLVGMWPDIARM